jgi:hypothetical protein
LALPAALARVGSCRFFCADPERALSGIWMLRVEVLVTDFEKAVFETEAPI